MSANDSHLLTTGQRGGDGGRSGIKGGREEKHEKKPLFLSPPETKDKACNWLTLYGRRDFQMTVETGRHRGKRGGGVGGRGWEKKG